MSASESRRDHWQWENATAGAVAGFATVASVQPLDVIRTRFQVNDGRISSLPTYRNTYQALLTIGRLEGLRGLYAGFFPAVLGSSVSWGLYFFFYDGAKRRYSKNREEKLGPALHLASAAEAGALVCLCTNPIWLVKTRMQLQNPLYQTRPYSGFYDALRTIMKEEGWRSLYKGLVPSLFLVSHGAIQFTAYEELRRIIVEWKSKNSTVNSGSSDTLLRENFSVEVSKETYLIDVLEQNSIDYAALGASSKLAAILLSYPFQVIRSRLQQRPSNEGIPRYLDSWHVIKETARFEGFRGFYKGITPNLLKNVPASSITFLVYENVINLLKVARPKD